MDRTSAHPHRWQLAACRQALELVQAAAGMRSLSRSGVRSRRDVARPPECREDAIRAWLADLIESLREQGLELLRACVRDDRRA